ncbi:MAG TPA: STAS domain-containing protein [Verrucomicrobiae bacterium]|nr:STAS domain-containing protein [Verrucomicrobiae bacterium]
MHELQIKMRQVHGIQVMELSGAIDALAFSGLSATLTRMMEEGRPQVILDCTAVTYIGSAQLKGLLDFASRLRAHDGDMKCVGVSPTIQHVANLIAMGDLLEFHDELSGALQAFHPQHEILAQHAGANDYGG